MEEGNLKKEIMNSLYEYKHNESTESYYERYNRSSELLCDILKKIKSERESLEKQFGKPRSMYHR